MNKLIPISMLIVALSLGYYFVIFLPQKESQRLLREESIRKQEVNEAKERQRQLNFCLTAAEFSKDNFWDRECESRGLTENCSLPAYNADRVDDTHKEDRNECFRKFSQ